MRFTQMNIKSEILKSLDEIGFEKPTKIQEAVLPFAFEGKDIIGQAQTGTGKTAAFAIPILSNLDCSINRIQHLVIAPTRELANQIYDQLNILGKYTCSKIALILGGVSYEKQKAALNSGVNIVVATPGRLEDLLAQNKIDLSHIKTFTLDEADELLKIGFYNEIIKIMNKLPKKRQNFFFTATFDEKTKKLSQEITNEAKMISMSSGLETTEKIDQNFVVVSEEEKLITLVKFLDFKKPTASVIFGRTKRRVDELASALQELGFSAVGIQGDMVQKDRTSVLNRFKDQKVNIIVATDVMARGIDVSHVDLVFNFDLPEEIEYYTHRIGRTGRGTRIGQAISFVKKPEVGYIYKIMTETKSIIKEISIPSKEHLQTVWEDHLINKLSSILEDAQNKHWREDVVQKDILERYSPRELSILLWSYIIQEKGLRKNLKLTPEPPVRYKKNNDSNKTRFHSRTNSHGDKRNRRGFSPKKRENFRN
ncbi:DEAD/DEAH box helicase [Mycoplasmopsis pulmonis]|nr:DEAD/DEAH box helicase [Mycoplasmopsis pulmonis]MDZ7293759.1 DEAD/DEAH box helicase [Mycoplasmopsis pulmonis]